VIRMSSTTPETLPTELVEQRSKTDPPPVLTGDAPVEILHHRPMPFRAVWEAWRYRRIAVTVFWAVFVQMMRRFKLGPTWLILQTFMSIIGFTLIFGGGVFSVPTPNGMPYFLFMMVGQIGWQLFDQTLMMSTRGFQRVKLLRNFHLPLVWVPIVGSAQGLIRAMLYVAGYVIAVIYLWIAKGTLYLQLEPRLLLTSFVGAGLCLVLAWGVGMWTAPLYAWARDTRYVLRLILPFWLFLTPVFYPIDHLHGKIRLLATLNPLSAPVEMVKVGLLGAGSVRVFAATLSMVSISVIFLTGVWFITRFGHSLASIGTDRFGGDDDDDDLM
jgi:ABC-type polysaccharide/polyol phosphate export permease